MARSLRLAATLALLAGAGRAATAQPVPDRADPAPADPDALPAPVATPDPHHAEPPPASTPPIEQGAAIDPSLGTGSRLVRRRRDATFAQIMRGPFQSSRLFAMPTADVVGAYVLTLSGDGSLLQDPGVLSAAGVLALGFGDIAQLEYRHTEAISVSGVNAPVPSVGFQLKVPIPEYPNVPAFGVALRLGVPRAEQIDGTTVTETVHDAYLVGRLRPSFAPWLALHGGTRISSAQLELQGAGQTPLAPVKRTMVLPTAGWEIAMNRDAKLVGEVALAPQFRWMKDTADRSIGYGVLGRLGLRWAVIPSVVIDGSIGYQLDVARPSQPTGFDAVVAYDIRLGAEVFVPWGALACRATGVFCD